MFPAEREKGVYDIDAVTPASITAHAPGYIDAANEIIVGLQTDAPLKRAIMPYGGWRMVEDALTTYGYPVDPEIKKIFTTYRKTHNAGRLRRLPAGGQGGSPVQDHHRAAGRLRPRPDHRRLPPGRALRRRRPDRGQEAGSGRDRPATQHRGRDPRPRGARRADQGAGRAQGDGRLVRVRRLRTGPDRAGGRPVALLRLPRRGEGAERCGHVAGSDVDVPGRVPAARPRRRSADRAAGPGADRRPGDQAPDRPVPAHPGVRRTVLRRPDLGDRVHRRHGRRRPDAGHQDVAADAADPLQPGPGPGAEPDGALERPAARGVQAVLCAGVHRHLRHPVRVGRVDHRAVRRRRGDRLLRVGDDGRQADAVLRRSGEPGQDAAVRDQRRAGRDHRRAGRPAEPAGDRRRARLRRRGRRGSTR